MAKNDKDLQSKFDKEVNTMDEEMQELNDKLSRKVYGVGDEIRNLTDIDEDINLNVLEDLGQVAFDTSKKHLLEITGKDSETNMDLDETITTALEDLKKQVTMNPTFQERVMLEQEYNYLCAQMPQLLFSIKSKVDNILSPDGITKSFLNFNITKGDEKISVGDVEKLVENRDLEEFVKDIYVKTMISGTRYTYTVPYKQIARRILKKYKENRNQLVRENPDLTSSPVDGMMTKDEDQLFSECVENVVYADENGEDENLIRESINYMDGESSENLAEEVVLTEDWLLSEAKDGIAYKINKYKEELVSNYNFNEEKFEGDVKTADGDILFSEARKPFYNLTGCHIDILDNQRTIPVIINREIIGVYYIENEDFHSTEDAAFNISNMTGTGRVNDTYDRERREHNMMRRKTIIKKVADIVDRNLDKKFIKKNRKILDTIEHLMDENDYYESDVKIRFIPRKYITPFTVNKDSEGLGRSQIHLARIMAHLWILLNYSNAMNKFFHEKDKLLIEARTGVSTDVSAVAKRALKSVTDIYPLPSQLLDITETHGRMADVGRVIVPKGKNGQTAFDIDRIPGQEREQDYEFKQELEQIATTLVGTPYSLLDINSNTDYATNLINQDKREVQDSISYQISLEKDLSEFITKFVRYETDEDIQIEVKLPTPKGLGNDLQNDVIRKIEDKVTTVVQTYLGQSADPELVDHVKSELFKKETSSKVDWREVQNIVDKYKASKPENNEDEPRGY